MNVSFLLLQDLFPSTTPLWYDRFSFGGSGGMVASGEIDDAPEEKAAASEDHQECTVDAEEAVEDKGKDDNVD